MARSSVRRVKNVLNAGLILLGVTLIPPHAAWAQKNSGPLLSNAPPAYAPPAYTPPAYAPAIPRPVAPRPAPPDAAAGANPDANRLAQTLPLDPQTRGLQNQMPPDPHATERRLGLREPRGPATDMRNHTPSRREIVDALAPR